MAKKSNTKIENKKSKAENEQKKAINKEAAVIFENIVKTLDDYRSNYDIPNYLIEYVAIRSLCSQYEDYLDDLKELGPDTVGGYLDVMYK